MVNVHQILIPGWLDAQKVHEKGDDSCHVVGSVLKEGRADGAGRRFGRCRGADTTYSRKRERDVHGTHK